MIPATAAAARGTSVSGSSPFASSPAPASALAPDSASNSTSAPHWALPRPTESPETPAELGIPGLGTMPCQREEEEEAGEEAEAEEEKQDSFLLLEQSVTLGCSGEVDRLVAQIGETLQLNETRDSPATPCAPPGPLLRPPVAAAAAWADRAGPPVLPSAPAQAVGPAPPGALRCALGDRSRVRGRAAPYFAAEFAAGHSALPGPCRRGWLRSAVASRRLQQRRWPPASARAHEDDPHRLLQQLVLSGNLIKEAVRRIQRAVAVVVATGPANASGTGGGRSGPDSVALQPSGSLH
ncbi:GSK-3-binding protein FRAT2 [Phyllostomus hastatus]|uniref:GSK-3-binding protein FRAT2 n=1 Tax=Phyllostomus hastatus TaxID=9423 RepID=UPI001E684E8C|nr:GSK-3-binding protein FRAT2 [Phyllostomus hastatus]